MSRYLNLESAMCKELDRLEEKYHSGAEMSEGDLRRIDLIAHSLKSLSYYISKREAEEAQRVAYDNSNSYYNSQRYVDPNRYYMPNDRRW